MKRLLIAMACTIISIGAFASGTTPVKARPAAKAATKAHHIEMRSTEKSAQLPRRQMAFTFYDGCGQQMTVWVSGWSNQTNGFYYSFWQTAYEYAEGTKTADGCFPR